MMKMFFGFLIFAVGMSFAGVAQDLSIQECWKLARDHYPLLEGKRALAEISELNIQNVQSSWLPRLDLSGQATWQNDVPHVGGMPGGFSVPQAPKDQYKIWLDVNQMLYDGGRVKAKKRVEQALGEVEVQNIEVQLQEVDRRVAELFFALLMLNEQASQMKFVQEDLEARIGEMALGVKGGVVNRVALQSLQVEKLRMIQSLIALDESRKAVLDNLSLYTGQKLDVPGKLICPEPMVFFEDRTRAEYRLFDLQQQRLESGAMLRQSARMPVVSLFAQGGYGNPAYNMLNDAFDDFYLVGVRLKWNPWDWKQTRRSKAVFDLQKELVAFQRKTFGVNQSRAVRQLDSEVIQYQKMMQKDDQILQLQADITQDARSRLKNGTVTAADYLVELNAHARARLEKKIHHLQYLRSMALKYLSR